jgi:hypothetical protein
MNDFIFDFKFAICDWTRVPCGPARGGHVRPQFAGLVARGTKAPWQLKQWTTPHVPIATRKSKIANP